MGTHLEVSIIQDDCTSCGQCPDIVGRHFFMGADNIAYVKADSVADPPEPEFFDFAGRVAVADGLEEDTIYAAEHCPGDCIYVQEAES